MLVSADRIAGTAEHADSLSIGGATIERIGLLEDLDRPDEHVVGFPGATIVPGLRDAHFHPVNYTAAITRLTLKAAQDFEALERMLAEEDAALPSGKPLVGTRLDDEGLAERRLPNRSELDAMAVDRPVLLYRYCGHLAVANTLALEAAGIGPSTPDPAGGSFDRDESGHPNGILRETAVAQVAEHVGSRGSGLDPAHLRAALLGLAGLGLTSIGAIISAASLHDPGDDLALLRALGDDVPIRLNVLVIADTPETIESSIEQLSEMGSMINFLGYKDFADGSLGGHTAAMREPYADSPTTGTLRLDATRVKRTAKAALDAGGMVALHAIGDLANERVLDVFEELVNEGARPERLRVEHASILSENDISRFASLGVTASVQPAFMASETGWLHKRLGPDRLRQAYPLRSLVDAGVAMAGGSDCPVEPPSPLWGMAVARDRAGIIPEQGLDANEALELFTKGAAAAMLEPTPLAPGNPADFVVLDRNPLTCSPMELRNAHVLATYVNGSRVPTEETSLPVWTD